MSRPSGPPRSAWFLILCAVSLAARPGIAEAPYRVAVIDMFYAAAEPPADESGLIAMDAPDLDGDGLRDGLYHGDLVSLYLRDESIEIVPYPIRTPGQTKQDLLARLREIGERRRGGDRLDALLFCWESSTLISAIADTLRREDRVRYQQIVAQWGERDDGWRRTSEIITELEALAADGMLVVTIAGNAGPAWVNTYTFARGVLTVGAAEDDPDRRWATDNPLIDTHAQSRFSVRLVSHPDRPAYGYDVNEDGDLDVGVRRGSSFFAHHGRPRGTHRVLAGTSFAAPTALRTMLTGEAVRR